LLFIGYTLEDISFRVIFQAVTSFLKVERPSISIAVQLPRKYSDDKKAEAERYLSQYSKKIYEIIVYWNDIDKFVGELRERLDNFRSSRNKR
jgi:hypothetical protein